VSPPDNRFQASRVSRRMELVAMSSKHDRRRLADAAEEGEVHHSLSDLAEEVTVVFPRVQPRPGLKEGLHDDLLSTMRNRGTLKVVSPWERRRWFFIAGATVGSLIPLCGVLAYFVCSRVIGKLRPAT
jgi:hypothetical protein